MNSQILPLLFLFLFIILFIARRVVRPTAPITLDETLRALEVGPLQRSLDLGAYKPGEPNAPQVRLVNDAISIFYNEARRPDGRFETIDFVGAPASHQGGYIITFKNDKVIQWTQASQNLPVDLLDYREVIKAHKVLEATRAALK